MKKNKSGFLSVPYILWMLIFTLIPLGVVGYYALTDPDTGAFTWNNIFQLGTKYSAAMNCNYLDKDGKSKPMIMGCYGIGVGRAMASVMEQNHDDYGPVWPMSIAPWQVELCALNSNRDGVGEAADKLYDELVAAGVEVLYDDRGEKAGFMFSDADLLGIPLRVVVSPKSLAEGKVEFRTRACRDTELVPLTEVAAFLKEKIAEAEKACSC